MARFKFPVTHKFKSKIVERDGYKFHSKKEARRYDELKLLQDHGEVLFFLRQVPFHLPGNIVYRCDFEVFWSNGEISFEDVKGYKTLGYIRHKKMVETLYPIEIQEI